MHIPVKSCSGCIFLMCISYLYLPGKIYVMTRGSDRSDLWNGPPITRLRTVGQSRGVSTYLICNAVATKMPRVPPQTRTSNVGGFSAPKGVLLSVTKLGAGPASSPVFIFRNAVHPASARTSPCSQNRIVRNSTPEAVLMWGPHRSGGWESGRAGAEGSVSAILVYNDISTY